MTRTLILTAACAAFAVTTAQTLAGGGERCAALAAEQAATKAKEAAAAAPPATPAATAPATAIDLVICLDTSGSMQGLIDSARARIWDIVSDLALAKPTPKLRVALVTFGNDAHSPENGWTNVDADLTDDLDTVSQKLFALSTNGGTELVGRVVDRATKSVTWTKDTNTLRIMVVAGNESADQDQDVKYQDACKRAIEQGVVINAIYCGPDNDTLVDAWRDVARLADGRSACINQTSGIMAIDSPFDAEITALNASLNSTYLPYGSGGEWGCRNQQEQDRNASSVGNIAQRVSSKVSAAYCNGHWDLVDAVKQADFKLEEIDAKELPESMRTLKATERRAFVDAKGKERAEIQGKIGALGVKRAQFVAAEQAKAGSNEQSFERAIRDAVRSQAIARGLTFPAIPTAPATATTAPEAPTTSAGAVRDGC